MDKDDSMINYIRVALIILFVLLVYAIWYQRNHCGMPGYDPCGIQAAKWKANAIAALQDYNAVQQEISSNNLIGLSSGFIKESDLDNLKSIKGDSLDKLSAWFTKYPSSWISDRDSSLTISFASCYSGRCSSYAYLFHNRNGIQPEFTKGLIATITDSVSLGNDWYYISTECLGCGE